MYAAAAPAAAIPISPFPPSLVPDPVDGRASNGGVPPAGLSGASGFLSGQHLAEQFPALQQHVPSGQSLS